MINYSDKEFWAGCRFEWLGAQLAQRSSEEQVRSSSARHSRLPAIRKLSFRYDNTHTPPFALRIAGPPARVILSPEASRFWSNIRCSSPKAKSSI